MSFVNSKMQALKPSATLAVKAKANELKAQGRKIIDLSTGEPDMDTPDHIKDAAKKALDEGKTKYTAAPGIPELRSAVAEKLQTENALSCEAENVIICNGGKQAIHELFMVTLEPGDEVVIPSPYWVSYPAMVELAGGVPKILETRAEDSYKLRAEELKAALTEKTRFLILNSPSNPTGAAYTAAEQKELLQVLLDHPRVLVLSDEVYEKLTYGNFEFVSAAAACPELSERIATVNAFSKTYSMTGWRVGYLAAEPSIIKAVSKFQSQTTSNVSTPAQYAALAAVKGSDDFLVEWKQKFLSRIQLASEILGASDNLSLASQPEGAFYLFVRCEKLFQNADIPDASVGLATLLLETAGVAVVPGAAFGDDAAFRVSVAASDEDVRAGMEGIVSAVAGLVEK